MRRSPYVLAILLCSSALAFAQAPKAAPAAGGSVDQTLMDLERKWVAASLKNDTASLDTILAPDWSSTTVDGKIETRAEMLENVKKAKWMRQDVSEMKVRTITPDVAIVTGVWTGVGTDGRGQKVDTKERWTDVFAKVGGTWKCVASQSSTIKK